MPRLAVVTGVILILLGFVFFFLGEAAHRSPTAFIPSLFGIFIAAGGLVAMNPTRVKAGMHASAGFALLGLLGSLMGAKNWPALLSGGTLTHSKTLSSTAQLLMFLICGFFVVASVKWFATNRRAKAKAA